MKPGRSQAVLASNPRAAPCGTMRPWVYDFRLPEPATQARTGGFVCLNIHLQNPSR